MAPKTKKQKLPLPPEGWTRCHVYLQHKSRFCRQEFLPVLAAATGHYYCGNHLHLAPVPPQQHEKEENNGGTTYNPTRKRIPCPVDPNHHIFEDMLEKHVLKCPKTVARQKQEEQHFYCRDCNRGGHGKIEKDEVVSLSKQQKSLVHGGEELEWAKRVAIRVLQVHQKIFLDTKLCVADDVASQLTLRNIVEALPLSDLSRPEFDGGLATAVTDYHIKSGGPRHVHQQASLVGHLRRIGALESLAVHTEKQHNQEVDTLERDAEQDVACRKQQTVEWSEKPSRIVLEMGAGRGMTGLIVAGVSAKMAASTHLTMIERGSSRSRAEKFLRKVKEFPELFPSHSNYLTMSAVQWERIKCDLAHVNMEAVMCHSQNCATTDGKSHDPVHTIEQRNIRQLVVIAKHLCGVGTDLALKSLEPIKNNVTACIMVTCCHGVCVWKDYVGRDYLVAAMVQEGASLSSFDAAEFELLRMWSSGTVKDITGGNSQSGAEKKADDEHAKPRNDSCSDAAARGLNVMSVVEALNLKCGAQGLGRACQRLIDYGRREYLRHVIFSDDETGESSSANNVQLLHYVHESVTPQNAALMAHR